MKAERDAMADALKNLRTLARMIYSCRSCGMCGNKMTAKVPYVCPVREVTPGFDHFYARGKVVIARGLLEGELEMTPDLAEAAYSCTLCGNCMKQCGALDRTTAEPLVDSVRIVEALRSDLLREHPDWVAEGYRTLLSATKQYDNPWAIPRSAREKWCRGLNIPRAPHAQSDVLLFVGCTIASTPALHERARRAVHILRAAGINPAILGRDEPCCGSVQRRVGAVDMASDMVHTNTEKLNAAGCSDIVALCAGCANMLAGEYRAAGLKARVRHIVPYLAELIEQGRLDLRHRQSLTVCYHDPCHLGRHMNIYDQPRAVLQALPGVRLVERTATGANTICCGAGGGMRVFEGGVPAQEIARTGLLEAAQAGAEVMVSACPFCEMNLAAAADTLPEPMPVCDIIDLVYDAVKGSRQE
jgi:heterodisulfide reductase subunit D